MELEYSTNNPLQTKGIGEFLAKQILKTPHRGKALILALEGELGGGKTTFLQGFAKGLGVKEKILSPTFVIVKRFQLNNLPMEQFSNFYHIDCYRIKKTKEILDLGFQEIISNSKNIITIEWAERIKKILPKDVILVKFDFINPVRDYQSKKRAQREQISNGVNKKRRKIVIKYPL